MTLWRAWTAKFGWPALALCFGIVLGGSYVASLQIPLPPTEKAYENSYKAAEAKRNQKSGKEKSLWFPDDSTGFYALWTAAFTGILAVSTIGLWIATGRTFRVAERALNEHERPWLFLSGVTMERRPSVGGLPLSPNYWFIKLHWKNVGRAPAIVQDHPFVIIPLASLPERPIYSPTDPRLSCDRTITPDTVVETTQVGPQPRPEPLAIYGKIVYTELNGKPHETGFALEVSQYLPASNPIINPNYGYYT
jgi:hypothetical protein